MADECDNCNKNITDDWEKCCSGENYFCCDECELEFMNKEDE